MIKNLLFIICFSSISFCWAGYSPESYGEKDFEQYYGSRELMYRVDPFSGVVIFEEKDLFKNYTTNLIQKDLNYFSSFFFSELASSLSCPESELSKMYDYLQFTNRVLVLSYLYENINAREKTAVSLDMKNTCSTNWEAEIKKCTPKSSDMKFFVKSAKHIVKNRKKIHASSSMSLKAAKKNWISGLKKKKLKDEAHYRILGECKKNNCSSVSFDEATEKLKKTCSEDVKLFQKICSEKDSIFGLNYISESYPLIVNSDILEIADENGYASGCLRRFKQLSAKKEVSYTQLRYIFPITYSEMLRQKKRYLQGDLFPAGSLKKFVDQGLEELFKEEVKKVAKQKIAKKKIVSKKNPTQDKVEFIDRFVKKKRNKIKVRKRIVKKKKKKEIRKSSFLVAVELRDQFDSNKVKVDMNKFKYDFLFSISLKKILDTSLQDYISRSGLIDMRDKDLLGTKKGPMPLLFLKYLIETDKHQALFNLTSILGNRFFVKNDIDLNSKKKHNYIELLNDQTTNYTWSITVLKEPSK